MFPLRSGERKFFCRKFVKNKFFIWVVRWVLKNDVHFKIVIPKKILFLHFWVFLIYNLNNFFLIFIFMSTFYNKKILKFFYNISTYRTFEVFSHSNICISIMCLFESVFGRVTGRNNALLFVLRKPALACLHHYFAH